MLTENNLLKLPERALIEDQQPKGSIKHKSYQFPKAVEVIRYSSREAALKDWQFMMVAVKQESDEKFNQTVLEWLRMGRHKIVVGTVTDVEGISTCNEMYEWVEQDPSPPPDVKKRSYTIHPEDKNGKYFQHKFCCISIWSDMHKNSGVQKPVVTTNLKTKWLMSSWPPSLCP